MALNTEKQIKSIFYNNTEIPLAAGNAGYSITFPNTATNWNHVSFGVLLLADGSIVDMSNYSNISGKTFSNVIAIRCEGNTTYALRMDILSGKIATVITTSMYKDSFITTDGGTTFTNTGNGSYFTWILLADTVLSSIEMYDTD